MSSLGFRKLVRTYSRQRKPSLRDEEPPAKRRRVEPTIEITDTVNAENASFATSSSPSRNTSTIPVPSPKESTAIFSDELPRCTPPSSPLQQMSSPPLQMRRPAFSFLKRRPKLEPSAKEPLMERNHNVPSPGKQPPKKKRLVQMQLDLVGELRKTCKVCGMEYIPSNTEDAALHRKFHTVNVGGVDFTKSFVERLKQKQVWAGADGSFIAAVGRKDALAFRNKASEVLKVVNTELAAVAIPEEELWSQTRTPIVQTQREIAHASASGKQEYSTSDRFKAYLYVRGQKCVGACLAERIQEAYTVLDQDDASGRTDQLPADIQSSSISIGTATEPAMLGISRIWTSNPHRKQGIATRLLDSARSDFLYGMAIEKAAVAFSQPTESGGQLARKWFGQRAGWHVYID